MMKEELLTYIDRIFAEAPSNDYARDLKDEVTADTCSKYDDCIKDGMTEAAAYAAAIRSMGNVDILIDELKNSSVAVMNDSVPEKYHSAAFESGFSDGSIKGLGGFFDRITPENENTILGAIIPIMWLLTVIIYFVMNFIFQCWDFSWLIFLVAACMTIVTKMLFKVNRLRREPYNITSYNKMLKSVFGTASALLWIITVIIYFAFSIISDLWEVTWLIYLVSAIAQILLRTFFKLIRK